MKTNALITRKTYLCFFIGILSLAVTSCGSYQNSSYNDNDGVYNTNGEKVATKNNQSNSASVQYKQYFSSLQSTSGDETFTDVNSYSSGYNTENDSIQQPVSTGYASWGSAPTETTVTVYPDTYWSVGFGWGYPYYGYGYPYYPYYGYGYYPWYGYPGYGWGRYPGYGWGGYPGYGHYHPHATPYAYNYSRRGSSYGGNYNRATPYASNSISNRNGSYSRNSIYSRNNVTNRATPTFTNRNSNVSSGNYTQNQQRSSYSQNRSSYNNSSNNYQRSSSNYTPSSNSTYRSSGSNMSSGGGARMSSGGGGGRMGGGGRR